MLRTALRGGVLPKQRSPLAHAQYVRRLTGLSVGIPKETDAGETRVAITPQNVEQLIKKGATVTVESGAGALSGYTDEAYKASGADISPNGADIWKKDMVMKVRTPTEEQCKSLGNRSIIGMFSPRVNSGLIDQLAAQGATVFSMDMLLRTLSRGQTFDVLSSQANMAGYRAVVEAGHIMQRPFAGQMTAGGKIPPTRVMVVGAGVAGLAAIQAANNLGAIVSAFDVRAAAAEQVEAMGAKFLGVDFEEDGSAAGGYAKEMSKEWFEAADKMLLKECANTDVIITTALIPGRPAPLLIKQNMVEAMPNGGVTVDLAAEAGGNVATTVPDEVVSVADGRVTSVGYTNFPARMASTSSFLFGNNVTKFLMSMDKEGQMVVDLENDEAVRSICVVHKGTKLEPYVPPPPEPAAETATAVVEEEPVDPEVEFRKNTMWGTVGLGSVMAMGSGIPNAPMLSTFALSVWVGAGAVTGVTHALHSPLMAVTNAISGMTIVGGMLQLNGGIMPANFAGFLGSAAVGLSAVNLTGGFLVTKKMLDLFRRADDPPEYWHMLAAPPAVVLGGYGIAAMTGTGASPALTSTLALTSGLGCVAGLSCLSSQETARAGIWVASSGVALGLGATLNTMTPAAGSVYGQFALFSLLGGGAGAFIASRVGPTQLPEAVAGFHALVGLAATATAAGDYIAHDLSHMDTFHASSLYLGAWMGSITFTGSCIAYGKLSEKMDNAALMLPGRDYINLGLAGTSALGLLGFCRTESETVATTALSAGIVSSGALGLHMTASIGGADMPVVITLLNSYSGWALCAEGFILDQPVLTIVGALIGSSGAFLTKIMCDGMNRSLPSVILGGFGQISGESSDDDGEVLPHVEVTPEQTVANLQDAQKIMITPGYGLAVAQAQTVVAEMGELLRKDGKTVTFGVHPVAGRMPGQLNVLLAEAGVPYDMVLEMEEVNEEMEDTDIAMCVGCNDTVNSLAEEDPNSAIGGMPVIQVWNAKQVVFLKRSMATGYAGVQNPVFYKENTVMLLGDAKDTLTKVLEGLRNA